MAAEPEADLRVVLVGQERVGKSSAGNTILGRKEFNSELSLVPLTLSSKKAEGEVLSRRVSVVDTPGLCSSVLKPEEVKAEIQRAVELSSPGPHVFLLTIQLGRFTEQEKRGLKMLQEILGPEVSKNTMILFTYGDRLEQTGIDIHQFVQRDENLQKLVKSCSEMYHVFNNQKMEDRKQVQDLLEEIDSLRKRRFFPKIITYYLGYSPKITTTALVSIVLVISLAIAFKVFRSGPTQQNMKQSVNISSILS
ncbi:GTPase IMAP family member 7-like isoform X2 [Xiphophorus couchianus]|uniref:GTPase IMAP family member 7-like isoform X2 n=1 Tax=Xiphophorus couchianus TaxID=32473 RepID=UPI0010167141|nr:GTPase IMAP family member 7-like isoform X2 [Xiphophorus couchianus]